MLIYEVSLCLTRRSCMEDLTCSGLERVALLSALKRSAEEAHELSLAVVGFAIVGRVRQA